MWDLYCFLGLLCAPIHYVLDERLSHMSATQVECSMNKMDNQEPNCLALLMQ